MRPIACTNTDGKLYWSIMDRRLSAFMKLNGYFQDSLQKGFLADIAGCVEHTFNLNAALKNAKSHHREICVAWLDLKNAFGSVRHNLIQFALKWYNVPEWMCDLVFQYYDTLCAAVTCNGWTTKPLPYEIGVFQGCVISPTLFLIVYQIVLDYVKQFASQPYVFKKEECCEDLEDISLLQMAYADDHTLINSNSSGTQMSLALIQKIYDWTQCLCLKPTKCWCLALGDRRFKKGLSKGDSFGPFDPQLKANGHNIGVIGMNDINPSAPTSFKFLGRKIRGDLKDTDGLKDVQKRFFDVMEIVNNKPLNGISKAWIYSNFVVSLLLWELMIYDLSKNQLREMESEATRLLKSWLGLHVTSNPAILYLPKDNFGLGYPSILDKYMGMQLVKAHIVKNSKDRCTAAVASVVSAKQRSNNSRQWKPFPSLEAFESALMFESKFPSHKGKFGLGFDRKKVDFAKATLKQKRELVSAQLKLECAHNRRVELHGLAKAGTYLKWDQVMNADRDWSAHMFGMSPKVLSFALNAQSMTLADPSNLRRWGITPLSHCHMCSKPNTTYKHIINGCPVSLFKGRYKWRHDNVLGVLQQYLPKLVAHFNSRQPIRKSMTFKQIHFVSAGAQPVRQNSKGKCSTSLLSVANDWELSIDDITGKVQFPAVLSLDSLQRPDILFVSHSTCTLIWAELTVPLEERVIHSQIKKTEKYNSLATAIRLKGWTLHPFTVEIGSLGFVAPTMYSFLSKVGFSRPQCKTIIKRASLIALRSSFYIWCSRQFLDWDPPALLSKAGESAEELLHDC